ncbi:MAG: DUF1501 domain-containing protein [Pirellulaceae bacterium]
MFSFGSNSTKLCEGTTRREWLRVGGLSSMGLMLPQLLAARSQGAGKERGLSGTFGNAKSCIVCFLFGAPAHQDIWDLKPDASDDIRGEFEPISTSVPGTFFGEHIPRTAKLAHKFALIRSMTHPDATHTVAMHYMLTGQRHRRPATNPTNLPDDFPCYGAAVNRLSPSKSPLPAGISLNSPGNEIPSNHIFPGFFAGFLGHGYDPMFIASNPADGKFDPFPTAGGAAKERVREREDLARQLDGLRARLSVDDSVRSAATFQDKALSIIRSPEAVKAFDLTQEKQTQRDAYGMSTFGQGCLLARRLVESGVRLVTVNWARDYKAGTDDLWDTHAQNFKNHKERLLPPFDLAYSALLTDLEERGLLDETLVVVLGEFGRTPKINKGAGRDHWPGCFSITLAGAGIRGGLVHGASDKIAAYPSRDPVSPEEIAATIYHALGIPLRTELIDHSGRPLPLATAKPLLCLFG